jgi:dipeptidase E
MRLLLSSQFLDAGQRPAVLAPSSPTSRAGIVANALDELGEGRSGDLAGETRTIEAFGYSCEELDLREYFGAPEDLGDRLGSLDLVWVLGGNTFVLARAMTQSGFADALREHLRRPEFVYGGYSAGACVAGPDLHGIDLMDDPTVVPERYSPAVEPRCLGLVPFRIVPHWRSDGPLAPDAERAATYLTEAGLDHRCLRDGQTITVQNGSVSVT